MPAAEMMRRTRVPVCATLCRWTIPALLVVFLAGCDALGEPETLVLQEKEETFRFVFNGSEVQPGQAIDIVSRSTVDLTAQLQADGFAPSDVVAARVTSAELERIQPLPVFLDFLNTATLSLQADAQTVAVASGQGFTSGARRANLTVTNSDVSALVRRPVFRAVLRIDPAQVDAGQEYRLEVTVRFRVEVEAI